MSTRGSSPMTAFRVPVVEGPPSLHTQWSGSGAGSNRISVPPSGQTMSSWGSAPSGKSGATSVGSRPGDAPNVRRGRAWVTGGTGKKPVNRTALEYDAPGTGKRIQHIPYVINKEENDFLRERFPGTVFQSTDDRCHDHPIAHTSTLFGVRQLQRMLLPGCSALDVYGNPNANEKYNQSQARSTRPKHIDSMVFEFTPKDALRRFTKWGDPQDANGIDRYVEDRLGKVTDAYLSHYDTFTFIHSLYYIPMTELCRALNVGVGQKRALALVHRFSGQSGKLNNGEQTFLHDERGFVHQTNVASNDEYIHPDVEGWFTKDKVFSDPVSRTAFTWECQKVCDDLWIICAVTCKYEYEASLAQPYGTVPDRMTIKTVDTKVVGPLTFKTGDGLDVILDISNQGLFERLCHAMVGRERSSASLRDLFVIARRIVNPGDLLPGKKGVHIDSKSLADHVVGAFLYNVSREVVLLEGIMGYDGLLKRHISMTKGSTVYSLDDIGDILGGVASIGKVGYRASRSANPLGSVLKMLG